ncbi:MAG TPA: hypothetical protein VGM88_03905 [Kofleriaceae bacterium]|jgi:hypothetical protein
MDVACIGGSAPRSTIAGLSASALVEKLPKDLEGSLPTIEQIEAELATNHAAMTIAALADARDGRVRAWA